jgi:hypothetical protein
VVGRLGKYCGKKVIWLAAQLTAGASRELNVTVPARTVRGARVKQGMTLTPSSRPLTASINQIRGRRLSRLEKSNVNQDS